MYQFKKSFLYTSETDFENEKLPILKGSKNVKYTETILKRNVRNPDKEILQNVIKWLFENSKVNGDILCSQMGIFKFITMLIHTKIVHKHK